MRKKRKTVREKKCVFDNDLKCYLKKLLKYMALLGSERYIENLLLTKYNISSNTAFDHSKVKAWTFRMIK